MKLANAVLTGIAGGYKVNRFTDVYAQIDCDIEVR